MRREDEPVGQRQLDRVLSGRDDILSPPTPTMPHCAALPLVATDALNEDEPARAYSEHEVAHPLGKVAPIRPAQLAPPCRVVRLVEQVSEDYVRTAAVSIGQLLPRSEDELLCLGIAATITEAPQGVVVLWVGEGVHVKRHEHPCHLQFVHHVVQYVERFPTFVRPSTDEAAVDLPRWRSHYRRAERKANRIEVVLDEEANVLISSVLPQLVNTTIGLEPRLPVEADSSRWCVRRAAGAGAYPIRPFNMKLVLKAVLVGSDPQPLTVGTHVERNRERLALYHAPRDARHASARRQQGAYFVRGDRYSSLPPPVSGAWVGWEGVKGGQGWSGRKREDHSGVFGRPGARPDGLTAPTTATACPRPARALLMVAASGSCPKRAPIGL